MTASCLNCTNWRLKEAGAMAREGFGLCAKGPRWHYLPGKHTCGRHAAGEPVAMAARVKWLGARA